MACVTPNELFNIALRDDAILSKEYNVFNRDTQIEFKCGCGEKGSKTQRRLMETGVFCRKCTMKRTLEKVKITRDSKRSVEETLSREHAESILKSEEDEESALQEWRNSLINSINIRDNVWYCHPIQTHYSSNSTGMIRSIHRKTLLRNGKHKNRTTITINAKKYQAHRFIMECLYNISIPLDYDIDHIDQDPGNNFFSNLQILTRKEHCAKTASDNPGRGIKATQFSCTPVNYIEYDTEGTIIKTSFYKSINDACRVLKITSKPIRRSLDGKRDKFGNQWVYQEKNCVVIEGEEWKEDPLRPKLFVSNKGRVENKQILNSFKTFGSVGEYFTIQYKGRQLRVHDLVGRVFLGEPPTKDHTIDHKDRNGKNNNVDNLQWATKQEQARNRSSVRKIEVFDLISLKTVAEFNCQKDCCEYFKCHASQLSAILNKRHGRVRLNSENPTLSARWQL